jgi:hypothetical protein
MLVKFERNNKIGFCWGDIDERQYI